MVRMTHHLAKNTLLYTGALIGQKAIAFIYNILIANMLGVEGNGRFFFAVSFATIFSTLADFGLSSTFIREGTQRPEERKKLFSDALTLKLPFAIAMVVIVNLAALAKGVSGDLRMLIGLVSISFFLESIHLLFFAVLRSIQKLRYESVILFAGQILIAAIGSILLYITHSPLALALALVIGNSVNVTLAFLAARKEVGITLSFDGDWSHLKTFLKIALPFALANIFVKIYSYVDSLFLQHYSTETALGLYGVAYKFTYAFQFLPLAFIAGLYPAFADYYARDKSKLPVLFERSIWYMSILAFPLVAGVLSVGDKLIAALFRAEYAAAVPTLYLLFPVLIVIFLDFPVMALINATHRQNYKTALMGLTVIVNVLLNWYLVPRYAQNGAAVAALISFSLMFLIGFAWVWKWFGIRPRILVTLLRVFAASGAMYLVVLSAKPFIHWIPLVLLGVISYAAALFAVGGMHKSDLLAFKQLIRPAKHQEAIVNGG